VENLHVPDSMDEKASFKADDQTLSVHANVQDGAGVAEVANLAAFAEVADAELSRRRLGHHGHQAAAEEPFGHNDFFEV